MSPLILAAIVWVFCGVAVAMLSMWWQYRLVPILAVAAVVILTMIIKTYGWIVFGLALAAFVSMMRHPLLFLWWKLHGEKAEKKEAEE